MQEKTNRLENVSEKIGLKISSTKIEVMKFNTMSEDPITLRGTNIEEVTDFVHLGCKVTTDGDSMTDVLTRISKATRAYAALQNIWRSAKISTHQNQDL